MTSLSPGAAEAFPAHHRRNLALDLLSDPSSYDGFRLDRDSRWSHRNGIATGIVREGDAALRITAVGAEVHRPLREGVRRIVFGRRS